VNCTVCGGTCPTLKAHLLCDRDKAVPDAASGRRVRYRLLRSSLKEPMKQISFEKSFLVVDDDPRIIDLLVRTLEVHNLQGRACTSGKEALSLLREEDFHIVLSDMNTPDRDGMQLLEKVRAEFPEVAFVMITGTDDVRRGVQLIREGASDYLLRPFQMDTVI
jgi:CheY-like chemotaxis protein